MQRTTMRTVYVVCRPTRGRLINYIHKSVIKFNCNEARREGIYSAYKYCGLARNLETGKYMGAVQVHKLKKDKAKRAEIARRKKRKYGVAQSAEIAYGNYFLQFESEVEAAQSLLFEWQGV